MYEAHKTENNREVGALAQEVGGYLGTEPAHPTTPRRDSRGPWDPRVLFPQHPPPTAPTPQLMGLKGKGYRAGLSGNDRKKRGEEGGSWGGAGRGGGDGLSRPKTPKWACRGGPHTHLSLGCPLLRPPTGPHPHTRRPHLQPESHVVREAAPEKGTSRWWLPGNMSGGQALRPSTLQVRTQEAWTGEALTRCSRAASSRRIRSPLRLRLYLALKAVPPPTTSGNPFQKSDWGRLAGSVDRTCHS